MNKNQRLNASITIGSVLESSVKKNVGVLREGLNQVGGAIKEVEKRQRELSRESQALRGQGESVAHLETEYRKLEDRLGQLRRAQKRWTDAAAATRRVGSSFAQMTDQIGKNTRQIAVGATLAAGSIFGVAASTASLGDNVAKTAAKLGTSTAALQELRYAAERSGVEAAQFDTAFEKMQKNLGEAFQGTGAAKDALESLGVSISDLKGLAPEAQLGLLADHLSKVEDHTIKVALANDIFGRSGVGMINVVKDGADGLRVLREDARRTGYVLSEKAARDAEAFQDALLDTKLTVQGLKNTFGAELMPVITGVMQTVGDALIKNRGTVKEWATSFAGNIERAIPVIGQLADGMGKVASVVGSVVSTTADMVGGWENFGAIIGAVLASKTILAVANFGASVFSLGKAMWALGLATPIVSTAIKGIGVALSANPIGLAVAGIVGGAALIVANWETIGPWFSDLLGGVKTHFSGISEFVGGVFTGDMARARKGAETAWGGTKEFYSVLWGGVKAVFKKAFDGAISPIMDKLGMTEPITRAWEGVKGALGSVLEWLSDKFQSVWTVISPVVDGLRWVKEKGSSVLGNLGVSSGENTPPTRGGPFAIGPQTNALGGPFRRGWHLTGERGPELKFESRAGWVANNRSLRQMVGMAERAARLFSPNLEQMHRVEAAFESSDAGPGRSSRPPAAQPIIQNITNHIDAGGMSAEELWRFMERKSRQIAEIGLFDRAPDTGLMGR